MTLRIRTRRLTVLVASAALTLATVHAGPAAASPLAPVGGAFSTQRPTDAEALPNRSYLPGKYVVTLQRPPVAAYTGGVADIPATKPEANAKVEMDSQAAQDYSEVLRSDQAAIAASVGVVPTKNYAGV